MNATISTPHTPATPRPFQGRLWTARILGTLAVLFLFVDAGGKILRLAPYVEGTAKVGFPPGVLVPLGLVLLASTLLYVFRRTAVFGALLLTAYLGGAVATHVRMGQPFIMPVIFGIIVWGCLYIRDERVRSLLPFARPMNSDGKEESHG
ncbi:MAG TPA: DoxX family protein [Polyangiaceae bacterium]